MRKLQIFTTLFVGGMTTAAEKVADKKPNIIFIMADQWRKHAVGFMNQDRVSTPELDRLAAESAVFVNAQSTVAVCTPNRACLLTGKYSINNGVLCNKTRLTDDQLTFGEVCKSAGYQTAYIGKWHIGEQLEKLSWKEAKKKGAHGYVPEKFRHGFDYWYQSHGHQPFNQPYFINEAKTAERLGNWEPDHLVKVASEYLQKRDREKPVCMVMSFGPPHTGGGKGFDDRFWPGKKDGKMGYGYAAPEKYEKLYQSGGKWYKRPVRENVRPTPQYEESKSVQGYLGAITAIDEALGRFLKTMEKEGLTDDTILVFTADHGEMLGSHGYMGKGLWYQESIGIPLIIHYPGKIKPAQYDNVFNSIDIMPTMLGLAELAPPADVDGVDYTPQLTGKSMKLPKYAFGAFFKGGTGENWRQYRTVVTSRYTYVMTGHRQSRVVGLKEILYDRQADPLELQPIKRGGKHDDLMNSLKQELVKHLKEIGDPFIEDVWKKKKIDENYDFYQSIINNHLPLNP